MGRFHCYPDRLQDGCQATSRDTTVVPDDFHDEVNGYHGRMRVSWTRCGGSCYCVCPAGTKEIGSKEQVYAFHQLPHPLSSEHQSGD